MFYKKTSTYGREERQKQVDIKVSEIHALINELAEMSPEFHKQLFGDDQPNVKIDMSELILSGHSFGGITAVTAAARLPENV